MCLPGTVEAVGERVKQEGLPKISRRTLMAAGAGTAAGFLVPSITQEAEARHRGSRCMRDLTHTFREGFPVYTFARPVRRTLVTVDPDGFYSQEWTFGEHSGTHMDAPGHFIEDGRRTPQIRLHELFAPVAVVDISRRVERNPDAVVRLRDLHRHERLHGRIPRGAAVFMYSGWESRVDDPKAYKNRGPDGLYHFPGFGIRAVEWLLEHRSIKCIGVDTLSLDFGASTTFDVHLTLLGANKYGLENLANLKRIPARGAHVFVGVVPWEEGSGGPCRVIAHW